MAAPWHDNGSTWGSGSLLDESDRYCQIESSGTVPNVPMYTAAREGVCSMRSIYMRSEAGNFIVVEFKQFVVQFCSWVLLQCRLWPGLLSLWEGSISVPVSERLKGGQHWSLSARASTGLRDIQQCLEKPINAFTV